MSTIDNIIKVLGYDQSEFLFYRNDFLSKRKNNNLSLHVYRVIKELDPYAVYCIENKPFVLFFEHNHNNKEYLKSLYSKIWNAQIPVVIISFEDHIEIYNGCSLNMENQELVHVESVSNELLSDTNIFSYWNMSNTRFWQNYADKFLTPTIDTVMLNNIGYITSFLKRTPCAPFALKIILRLIFIRFLIDRGVDLSYKKFNGDIIKSREYLLEIMESKDELYSLFSHLKAKFNGNLFELFIDINSGKSEQDILDSSSLAALRDFMSGELELDSGQYSLFPLYDFNIIPIELISNIYERFLGENKQKQDKAFYTPPYLVDYVLNQTIRPYLKNNSTCTVLDPACGSGIFLVQAARSLIENNLSQEDSIIDDDLLVNIVTNNIFGIDKNSEAIDVAIFSIYLTMLDYKDPKTLKNFKLPMLKGKNFFVYDFFYEEVDKLLGDKHFDFIIGNPPWGRVDNGIHIEYCKENNIPLQDNEIARSFIARTKDFSQKNTTCCLIVTSKLFYNIKSKAIEFRKWLLTKTKIVKYIELAAVRELIFANSKGPAAIIIYKFNSNQEENKNNEICHLVLKPNIFFKLFNVIVIEKNDYKYIKQSLLLENDWAWKTIVFGTTQDFYTIKRLKSKYPSVKDIIDKNRFISQTGIQISDGDMYAGHLIGKPLIDSKKGISAFKVDTSFCTIFNKRRIHRVRDERMFKPPYVLIKKGFDTKTYKLRAAYSEEEFLYRDAITGIVGCKEKKEILLSLTGLINSSLYAYFNLMLGASTGIEREQSFPTEIYNFPAIIDSKIAHIAEKIQDSLNNDKWLDSQNNQTEKLIQELDELVLECFNLKNDPFVDYALNIEIPLLVGKKTVYEQVDINQLRKYADVFLEYFNGILLMNKQYMGIKVYRGIMNHFVALEFIIYDQKPENSFIIVEENENTKLELFSKFMLNKVNEQFYQIKDVIDFEERSFYILKTDETKNWHPAIAKLDLSDVIDSILSGGEMAR